MRRVPDLRPKAYDLHVGKHVQVHPATDLWMRGDRYGVVTLVGRKLVHLKMDKSGKLVKLTPENLIHD